jgi:hypothetical protein
VYVATGEPPTIVGAAHDNVILSVPTCDVVIVVNDIAGGAVDCNTAVLSSLSPDALRAVTAKRYMRPPTRPSIVPARLDAVMFAYSDTLRDKLLLADTDTSS